MSLLRRVLVWLRRVLARQDDPELVRLERNTAKIKGDSEQVIKTAKAALRRDPAIIEIRRLDRHHHRRPPRGRPA